MTLTKIGWVAGALGIAVMLVVAAVLVSFPRLVDLGLDDPRPTNVPSDATPIPQIGKTWLWAKCWVEGQDTRCRIFDEGGDLLHDDVFTTYDRGLSVAAADLLIVPERSGRNHLWLKNGEILLPRRITWNTDRTSRRLLGLSESKSASMNGQILASLG